MVGQGGTRTLNGGRVLGITLGLVGFLLMVSGAGAGRLDRSPSPPISKIAE